MQDVVTVTVVLAGLFFSITCALLLEELMFGLFFRAMTPARRRFEMKVPTPKVQAQQEWVTTIAQQRHEEGGVSCSH